MLIDVIVHPSVLLWLEELQKTDIEKYMRLTEDNSYRFKRLLGDSFPKGSFDNCWTVNKNGLKWLIASAPEIGTIYNIEIALSREEFKRNMAIGIGIIKYLKFLSGYLINSREYIE